MEPRDFRNIKDDYKILNTLGRGSFASVKKAMNRKTGEFFAIKVFMKKKLTEINLEKLKTEIEVLRQLDHPNIVSHKHTFFDQSRSECGVLIIIMEFCEYGDLAYHIKKKNKLIFIHNNRTSMLELQTHVQVRRSKLIRSLLWYSIM